MEADYIPARFYPLLDRTIHRIIRSEIKPEADVAQDAVMMVAQVSLAYESMDKKTAEKHVLNYLMVEKDVESGVGWGVHHVQ